MSLRTRTPEAGEAARVSGNEAWSAVSRTIAGMLMYGGIGYAIGAWLGNATAGLAIGVIIGTALGLYLTHASIKALGGAEQPRLPVSGSQSWSAKMTRARIQRAEGGQTT